MGIPNEFDVTVSNTDGESDWLPLNRWASAKMRLTTTITGTPTYTIVGTQKNVLRNGVTTVAADEVALTGLDTLTAGANSVQDVLYRAIKVKVDSGTGSVRLRAQSQGDI